MAENGAPGAIDGPPAAIHGHAGAPEVIDRHSVIVRLTHWLNLVLVTLLLMSGLQIFNAHPRLYFGAYGANADPAWMEMTVVGSEASPRGVLRLGDAQLGTTGLFGVSGGGGGRLEVRGFPRWATLPSWRDLATGRRWHFLLAWLFVANGAVYLIAGAASGHFRRDLSPARDQLAPRSVWRDVLDHLRLRHPTGEDAKRYNLLQKLAYLTAIFILLPGMLVTGLAMSPGVNAAAPWLVTLLGGRQSARSIHFILANLIVLFVLVHVVEVFIAGVFNEVGSMVTGRYRVPQ